MEINDLTHTIIGCAYKVHNVLGFGFLERVYENALRIKLEQLGIRVSQQQELNVSDEGQIVGDYVPGFLDTLQTHCRSEVRAKYHQGTRSEANSLSNGDTHR
jgi:GxxExxY protein